MNDGALEVAKNLYAGLRQGDFDFANKANTSLVWHHGKLLALWEGGTPYEIRPADLHTIGRDTFDGQLKHAFTAHPKVDATTGEMLFFGYSLVSRDVRYGVLQANGRVAHTTSIRLPRPVMMHDFAISQRYTIFMDLPLTASLWRTLLGKPVYQFKPAFAARFGILPRYGQGAEIRWFDVQSCYVFHVLNAYDVGDEVVVHGCRYPHVPQVLSARQGPLVEPLLDAVMYCWRFNLHTGETSERPLDDQMVEFPRVDDSLIGTQRDTVMRRHWACARRRSSSTISTMAAASVMNWGRDASPAKGCSFLATIGVARTTVTSSRLRMINGNSKVNWSSSIAANSNDRRLRESYFPNGCRRDFMGCGLMATPGDGIRP